MTRNLLAVFLVLVLSAGTVPALHAQDDPAPADTFANWLAYVPDTPENRRWLTYGDFAAWYESWNILRPTNFTTAELLPPEPHAYWVHVFPRQTMPPEAFGLQYIMLDDQRDFYGFDAFQVDRALEAGGPPELITLLEHNVDPDAIAATLLESGYTAGELDGGWTLYSILDDYEIAMTAGLDIEFPRVGQLGQRNRIALNGQQMIIARATAPVTAALDAAAGDAPALAGDPYYAALAAALGDPALEGTGSLVGVMAMGGEMLTSGDPILAMLGPNTTPEVIERMRQEYGFDDPANLLPPFETVAFATFHARDDATYLVLALAFDPVLADFTDRAVSLLEANLPEYELVHGDRSLADIWSLDRTATITVGDVPVVLAVMRVEDPPPLEEGESVVSVWNWYRMVLQRDLLFLASLPAEAKADVE